ncbi:MFS transporter [Thermoflexus sp.]|uniref:MFS transporter n=1 Tax=Thermoflexus sp. TaxID=1969742 RepID=UPI002ADDD061|nr:MFS transporter [Thermoflexus sp.]
MLFRSIFRSVHSFSLPFPIVSHTKPALGKSAEHRSRVLHRFWWDGVLARLSDAFVIDYVPLFALALGAGPREIGWLNSLAQLIYAALLIPGARLAERWGRRKMLVIAAVSVARVNLVLWALLPFFLTGHAAIGLLVVTGALRAGLWGLGAPAWTSLAGEWVPAEIRGRYFGWRNLGSGIAALIGVPVAGWLITALGGLRGYQVAFAIAFLLGAIGLAVFASLPEESPGSVRGKRLPPWREIREQPAFLSYLATFGIWNFSLFLAAPFFNVHLVQNLGADARTVGLLTTVSAFAALFGPVFFGRWNDRWGAPRALLRAGLFIPLIPWAWLLARSPWHIAPINALAGFLWAGFDLCNFNTLLALAPEETRPRYAAFYNLIVGIASAAGAAVGGWIASQWGFYPLFALSGLGRLLAMGFYARTVLRALSPSSYGS